MTDKNYIVMRAKNAPIMRVVDSSKTAVYCRSFDSDGKETMRMVEYAAIGDTFDHPYKWVTDAEARADMEDAE